MTPMDACLNKEENVFNLKLVSVLFDKTMEYPLLHSSYLMQSAVCRAIEARVPEISEYITNRWKDSPQLKSVEWIINQELNPKKKKKIPGYEYVAQENPIWVNKSKLKE